MKLILGVLILAGLVAGAFFLGYNTETTDEEMAYAKEVMQSTGGAGNTSAGRSIGAYE